jgi:hypothetical protein
LPAIAVGGTARAKKQRRRWTTVEGRKMAKGAKGAKKGKEGKNAKGL